MADTKIIYDTLSTLGKRFEQIPEQISKSIAIAHAIKASSRLQCCGCFLLASKLYGDDCKMCELCALFELDILSDFHLILEMEHTILEAIDYRLYSIDSTYEQIHAFNWGSCDKFTEAISLVNEVDHLADPIQVVNAIILKVLGLKDKIVLNLHDT